VATAKKRPRHRRRGQFIREETPRKGRYVSDASYVQPTLRRTIAQAKNVGGRKDLHRLT